MSTSTLDNSTDSIPDLGLNPSFVPSKTIDEDKKVWAAAALADLPVVTLFHETAAVEVSRGDEDRLFRRAFVIAVSPGYRFVIYLFAGASPDDLDRAQREIREAKAGCFNDDIWQPTEFKSGRSGYLLKCFWSWDGVQDIDELRPCKMDGCIDHFHEYRNGELNDVHHAFERFVHPSGRYDILVHNYEDEEAWHPYLSLDGDWPTGQEGLKLLHDAANDYAWYQAECDKLNAAVQESAR